MFLVTVAQAMTSPSQSGKGGGSMIGGFFTIGLIFLVFYFLLIRPQQKQQKKLSAMREGLKKGDKIVTTGGIFGTIDTINPDSAVVYINDKTKIEVTKSSISTKRD